MRFALCVLLLLIAANAHAAPVKVGTVGSPPYVVWTGEKPGGVSVDLWNIIAERLQLESEFHRYDSLETALAGLKTKDVDLLVGPIDVKPDVAQQFAFTQPYHRVKLAAAVTKQTASSWHQISHKISETYIIVIPAMILSPILVGFLMWLFEHKKNPGEFKTLPREGIIDGIWFALSTATRAGFAFKHPVTWQGRLLHTAWSTAGTLLYTSIVALMITFLTLSTALPTSLSATALSNQEVIVADQNAANVVAQTLHARPVVNDSLDSAFLQVESGHAQAIILDALRLRQYIRSHPESNAIVLDTSIGGELYAFLFNSFSSKYYKDVTNEIIETIGDNTIDRLNL